MAGILLKAAGVVLVAIIAAIFPALQVAWKIIAYGRVLQPVSDFPYTCRRIENQPRLKACEDMWLSEATRQLFLACGDPTARSHWSPVVQKLNWEARSKIDAIIALDLDKPQPDGSFVHRVLPLKGYTGNDQGRIFMNGIAGADKVQEDGTVKVTIALTNYGPSVDPATGAVLDQKKVGSNATIEVFETTGPETHELRHVRTFADRAGITTPNRPTLVGTDVEDGFYVTNESRERAGLKAKLAIFVPLGNVVYCQGGSGSGSSCHEVATGYRFPNGLHRARDGLLYVPSSGDMDITAYREVIAPGEAATRTLEKVGHLDMDGYSVDNLAEDANGDLWLATFPKPLDAMAIASDPFNFWPRSTVFRIRKSIVGGKVTMTADKIIEDRDKVVLPGTTTVVHDAKTGRLFLSGIATPFITVCDPR